MIDNLLLLSGNDLPFLEASVAIHQPRLKEIAYITEERFWSGCELLKFNKESLTSQDKNVLLNRSNFNIIMTMVQEKSFQSKQAKVDILSILGLLFPTKEILLTRKTIQLLDHQTREVNEINEENFESFKNILIRMFCLTNGEIEQYNPNGELSKKIADKLKRGREKKAKLAPTTDFSILDRYVSILAVGQQKSINDLMDYTIYQLMDEYNRYKLKFYYDTWQRFKAAGASGMEDPEDWFKNIHQNQKQ